jgi:hypothetical protein
MMFSKEFANSLNQSINAMQQDRNVAQQPEVQHLTNVLRVLWREVERLERQVSVSANEIVLKSGSATVTLKADGTIAIKANNITIEATGDVTIKASRNIVMKASQILQN